MRKVVLLSILVVVIQHAVGVIAHAQQTGKVFRIGILDPSIAYGSADPWEALRQELSKLGWKTATHSGQCIRFSTPIARLVFELRKDTVRNQELHGDEPPHTEVSRSTRYRKRAHAY